MCVRERVRERNCLRFAVLLEARSSNFLFTIWSTVLLASVTPPLPTIPGRPWASCPGRRGPRRGPWNQGTRLRQHDGKTSPSLPSSSPPIPGRPWASCPERRGPRRRPRRPSASSGRTAPHSPWARPSWCAGWSGCGRRRGGPRFGTERGEGKRGERGEWAGED
jgi:hypothetical protein